MSTPVSPSVANPGVPAPSTGPAPHPRATPEARGLALGLLGVTIFALTLPMTRLAVVLPVMALFALSSNFAYASVGALLRHWLAHGRRLLWFNRAMALVLVVTAAWMVRA